MEMTLAKGTQHDWKVKSTNYFQLGSQKERQMITNKRKNTDYKVIFFPEKTRNHYETKLPAPVTEGCLTISQQSQENQ